MISLYKELGIYHQRMVISLLSSHIIIQYFTYCIEFFLIRIIFLNYLYLSSCLLRHTVHPHTVVLFLLFRSHNFWLKEHSIVFNSGLPLSSK